MLTLAIRLTKHNHTIQQMPSKAPFRGFFPTAVVLTKKHVHADHMLAFGRRSTISNSQNPTSAYQSNFQFPYPAENLWSKSRNLGIKTNEIRLKNHSFRSERLFQQL